MHADICAPMCVELMNRQLDVILQFIFILPKSTLNRILSHQTCINERTYTFSKTGFVFWLTSNKNVLKCCTAYISITAILLISLHKKHAIVTTVPKLMWKAGMYTSVSQKHSQTQTLTASKCIVYDVRNGDLQILLNAALSLTKLWFVTINVLKLVCFCAFITTSLWNYTDAYG